MAGGFYGRDILDFSGRNSRLVDRNIYGRTGILGKSLLGGYARSLDIALGILGACFGGYLFFWTVIGEGSSFSRYATAIFGSVALVGIVRLISARNLAWVRNNRF